MSDLSSDLIGDIVPPHQHHSDTSRAAAMNMMPKFKGLMLNLMRFFKARGELGMTDEEGQYMSGVNGNSYRPGRVKLAEMGMIKDSGARRRTRSGNQAVVWVVTSEGMNVQLY
jgi:hypothetical protein